jgi:cysteine desulfuration protein SufE
MTNFEQTKLIEEFKSLPSWEERYQKIIALGKELKPYPEKFRTDDNKVKGCQSQVWLLAELDASRKIIHLYADSDALIVKGLVALLLQIYSDKSPQEILEIQPDFIRELGFESNLSPSRTNGLQSMIKQIKYYALAFQALIK